MPTAWANKSDVSVKNAPHLYKSYLIAFPALTTIVAEFVNDKRLSHVPGPDNYEPPIKDKTQAPFWSVAKNDRFKGRSVKHPGPGEYEYA